LHSVCTQDALPPPPRSKSKTRLSSAYSGMISNGKKNGKRSLSRHASARQSVPNVSRPFSAPKGAWAPKPGSAKPGHQQPADYV
jgi:hypothetical protein